MIYWVNNTYLANRILTQCTQINIAQNKMEENDDLNPLISNGHSYSHSKIHEHKTDKLARKKLSLFHAAQYCLVFIVLDIAKQIFTYSIRYYNGNRYPLPQTQIVTWIEAVKLVFSLVSLLFFQNYGSNYKFRFSILFALPALIYTLNNNLYLMALNYTTPPIWLMLIQSRVFLTALAYKFFFGKKLTRTQWFGLGLLVSSLCILTFMNTAGTAVPKPSDAYTAPSASPVANDDNNFDKSILEEPIIAPTPAPKKGFGSLKKAPPPPAQVQNDPSVAPSNPDPNNMAHVQQPPNPAAGDANTVPNLEINIPPLQSETIPSAPELEINQAAAPQPADTGAPKRGFGSLKRQKRNVDMDPGQEQQYVSPMPPKSDFVKPANKIQGLTFMAILLSLLSATLSVTASIITEYFFKNDKRPFMEQQVQMYTYSFLISALFCFFEPNTSFKKIFTLDIAPYLGNAHVISPYLLLFLLFGTILLGALGGLAVAAIVKNLDNIVKIYCSSMGNMGTALVSWMLFPDRFKLDTYYSGALVLLFAAIYLYESPTRK